MIYLLIALNFNSFFETGLIPNGNAEIYNIEYWDMERDIDYKPIIPLENPDRYGEVFYTTMGFKLNFLTRLNIDSEMKTYAQKLKTGIAFGPYRINYKASLGFTCTDNFQIGYRHSCTHTIINMQNKGIFEGSYDEFYIRFEK